MNVIIGIDPHKAAPATRRVERRCIRRTMEEILGCPNSSLASQVSRPAPNDDG
jgi:hypothetical protein